MGQTDQGERPHLPGTWRVGLFTPFLSLSLSLSLFLFLSLSPPPLSLPKSFLSRHFPVIYLLLLPPSPAVCLTTFHTPHLSHRFVNAVAFHPDGNCIGVGTSDNIVKVYILYTLYIYFGPALHLSRQTSAAELYAAL